MFAAVPSPAACCGADRRHITSTTNGARYNAPHDICEGQGADGPHEGSVAAIDNGADTGIDDAICVAVNYFSHLEIEVLTN